MRRVINPLLDSGQFLRQHVVPLRKGASVVGRMLVLTPASGHTESLAAFQRALLPTLPAADGVDFGAVYHPAEVSGLVGGDFYDVFDRPAGRCVVVGDVSGRGPQAAAAGVTARAYLRATLSTGGVTGAVSSLNEALVGELAVEQFVTMAMATRESADVWALVLCGHPPPLLLRDGHVVQFRSGDLLLGLSGAQQWARQLFHLQRPARPHRPDRARRLGPGSGLRGNTSAPMRFRAVLPGSARLAPRGGGLEAFVDTMIPWFQLGAGAVSVGRARGALDAITEHLAGARLEHLDERLIDQPVVRHSLGRLAVDVHAAGCMLTDVAGHMEEGTGGLEGILALKAHANEQALAATDRAMRLGGGAAYAGATALDRLFRDARAGVVMAPTPDAIYDMLGGARAGHPLFPPW